MSDKEEEKSSNPKTGSEEKADEGSCSKGKISGDSTAGMSISKLQRYLAEKLGFYDDDDDDDSGEGATDEDGRPRLPKKEKVKVLEDVSVDGIIEYINKNKCCNIITMAGAGISTSAGIPDFRSPGSGLYHNLTKYNLPHPQAIFELSFFEKNPKPFFALAKELYPGSFKPTICHYFIKLLVEKELLLRHYTQNIDTLERVAEIPAEKIVEAHGTFHTGHCLDCRKEYSQDWMKELIFMDEIPICEDCPGVVKPDIVFFGENLPNRFHKLLEADFSKCDLLIVLGSSLAVQPFASLIDRVPNNCPRLLINREKAGHRTGLTALLGMGGGMEFDSKDNTRDVAWLGDCDDGCLLLAEKLGWGEELKELVIKEHKKIDEKNSKAGGSSSVVKEQKRNKTEKTVKEDAPADEKDVQITSKASL